MLLALFTLSNVTLSFNVRIANWINLLPIISHGANIIDYLLQQLKDAQNENVRHGGCLGLGLAAMGTHRQDVYEQLKFNLYQDDAITGEAAGIAMGMVMLGSKNASAIEDMVSVSQFYFS